MGWLWKKRNKQVEAEQRAFEVAHKQPKIFVDYFVVAKGATTVRVSGLECDVDNDYESEARLGFATPHSDAKQLALMILDQLGYKVTLASKVPPSKNS